MLHFLEYCLDGANAQLRRGAKIIPLRPKTLAVLGYFAAHPGRLVTKQELLDALWPDTAVGEWVLTSCVRELRKALDDDPHQPRAIETAHRHGYRFIAEVREERETPPSRNRSIPTLDVSAADPLSLVGRAAELAQLDAWFQNALNEKRQVVFIVGEPGIGKTTLTDAFLAGVGYRMSGVAQNTQTPTPDTQHPTPVLIARGQCIEQHGAAEPYLPVLEALGGLCAAAGGESVVDLLRRHAPAWLLQLPGILDAAEAEALERRLGTTRRERMLREMASFVAALPIPLIWVLEDLHWSDHATLDLVSMLAERGEKARLLLIATYRPVEVVVHEHPLKSTHNELRARGRCHDLWLKPLEEADVAAYLAARWPGAEGAGPLARVVHGCTDGNPLFLVNVAEYLAAEGAVAKSDGRWTLRPDAGQVATEVPGGLRQMIAAQIDRLPEADLAVLEAASLIGRTFSAALAAAALVADIVEVERQVARLADTGQLLRAAAVAEWPDGTVAGAYEFTHSVYQTVLRDRVPPARRRQLHALIAARLEAAYSERIGDAGAELAYHFEKSGNLDRAALHLEEAATRALRRGAAHQAVELLDHGLTLVEGLPVTPERTLRRIRLLLVLGAALPTLRGMADPAVEQAALRARALCEETSDQVQLAQVLGQLVAVYLTQARLDRAVETVEAMKRLVELMPVPGFVAGGSVMQGFVEYHAGELTQTERCFEQALAVGDVPMPAATGNVQVLSLGYLALTALHQGYADRARRRHDECMQHALASGRPFDRSMAVNIDCFLRALLADMPALGKAADEAIALATEHDLATLRALGAVARGRVIAAGGDESGTAMMVDGIEAYRATGTRIALASLLGWLTEVYIDAGDAAAAAPVLAEGRAHAAASGEVRYLPELQRLDGALHELRGDRKAAEESFRRAVELAREHGSRWWQLRASVSLARLQRQRRKSAARRAVRDELAAIVGEFTEGFDTVDVQRAQVLLAEIS